MAAAVLAMTAVPQESAAASTESATTAQAPRPPSPTLVCLESLSPPPSPCPMPTPSPTASFVIFDDDWRPRRRSTKRGRSRPGRTPQAKRRRAENVRLSAMVCWSTNVLWHTYLWHDINKVAMLNMGTAVDNVGMAAVVAYGIANKLDLWRFDRPDVLVALWIGMKMACRISPFASVMVNFARQVFRVDTSTAELERMEMEFLRALQWKVPRFAVPLADMELIRLEAHFLRRLHRLALMQQMSGAP